MAAPAAGTGLKMSPMSLANSHAIIDLACMTKLTVSQRLFEDFAASRGLMFRSLVAGTQHGKRTPDYEVTLAGASLFVEVTEVQPNARERAIERQLRERGYTDVFGEAPGTRLRTIIHNKNNQCKRASLDGHPTLLILFSIGAITDRHVEPYAIKTAMHGLDSVVIQVPKDVATSPTLIDVVSDPSGQSRALKPQRNTSLSGVSLLTRPCDGSSRQLFIYHNPHARVSLSPDLLRAGGIQHSALAYKTRGQMPDWERI